MGLLLAQLLLCAFVTKASLTACPVGTLQGPSIGDCYSLHYSPLSWFEAETACRSNGAHLVSVSGPTANAFTNELSHNWCYADYWLGASNVQNDRWRWLDGSTFNYTNWATGQPVQNTTAVFCLYASVSNSEWFSGVCDEPKPFFCRVEKADNADTTISSPQRMTTEPVTTSVFSLSGTCRCSTSTPPRTPPQQPKCPFGWQLLNETLKCYKLVGSKDVWDYSWNDSICSSIGGKIVSVHSDEENRVITAYAYSRTDPWKSGKSQMFFIGLHAPVGRWIWTDGSTYDYANWTANAAYDHCDGSKDCAVSVWLTTRDGQYGSWVAYNYDSFPYYGTKTVCQIEPDY